MSYYGSGTIKPAELEAATYVPNLRATFRFAANEVYLTNMKLLDIGVYETTNVAARYNDLAGALSCIRRIALYSDNELLDSVDRFALLAAFENYNKTNDVSVSRANNLHQTRWGFLSAPPPGSPDGSIVQYAGTEKDTTADPTTTGKAYLSLRDVLPFLASQVYLPTRILKNMRLEIEYDAKAANVTPGANSGIATIRPHLSMDVVTDPMTRSKVEKAYQGARWMAVEVSSVYVPPAANAEQNLAFTLNSYNNKNVGRLLVVKEALTGGTRSDHIGSLGSLSMNGESFNATVNGAQLLPQNVALDAERMAMVSDLFGDGCSPYMGMETNAGGDSIVKNEAELVGLTSYIAMDVSQKVTNNMQLLYNRAGVAGSPQSNEAMNLVVFGHVSKALLVQNGKFVMTYL